jgi:hypothetical protein
VLESGERCRNIAGDGIRRQVTIDENLWSFTSHRFVLYKNELQFVFVLHAASFAKQTTLNALSAHTKEPHTASYGSPIIKKTYKIIDLFN